MKKLTITGNVKSELIKDFDKIGKPMVIFFVKIENSVDPDIKIKCCGQLVEVAKKHIYKGCKVFVEGYPIYKPYLDENNNLPNLRIDLNAHLIELIS